MAFPESFIEELIARNDIVSVVSSYTALQKKGSRHFGLCPFHNEKTPSFTVTPEKDLFYCFGCGKGGGVISFVMEVENLDFKDAVYFLAKRAGMSVPEEKDDINARRRRRILEANLAAARWFRGNLSKPEGSAVVSFLQSRRINSKTAARFGLGAAPDSWDAMTLALTSQGFTKDELLQAGLVVAGKKGGLYDRFRNKLIFPVIDARGDVIGFGSRVLDDSKPKYVNSNDTPAYSKRKALYGMHLAKNTKRGNFILVEGNIDVLTLHQAGYDNAVATMGTALTTEQTRLIAKYVKELIICYDNDEAGAKATQRALELLKDSELEVRVLRLPDLIKDGKRVKVDVDDFIKERGSDAFDRLLSGSQNDTEYRLSKLRENFDLSDDAQRVDYLRAAVELIAQLPGAVEREVYSSREAQNTGVSAAAMRDEVERKRKALIKAGRNREHKQAMQPTRQIQPKSRALRYDNVRSAAAEEGVLKLAAQMPELISKTDLGAEEFTSPVLGKAWQAFCDAFAAGRSVGAACLEGRLNSEEAAHIAHLLSAPAQSADVKKAFGDYVSAIRTIGKRQAAQHDESALMAVFEDYRNKKGYGG